MDGINDELNKLLDEECKKAAAIKKAKEFVELRRPITRAKIQQMEEQRKLEKDFE
tara:strand:+ start:202 stop:366 length:165 start_codon:yes stop_codon:yes gene_type:complete